MRSFDKLVPLLVDAIPLAIASLRLVSPICIVRIYYYDTHAPCTYLSLRTISSACRKDVLKNQGKDGLDHLWASGNQCGDGRIDIPTEKSSSKADKELKSLFAEVYKRLCEAEDEEATMIRFGKMLCKVAKKLNAVDWQEVCPTTDDFAIVPADGTTEFRADVEDFIDSVPAARKSALIARGAVPKDWLSFDPKAAKEAYEKEMLAYEERARIERNEYWSRLPGDEGNKPCPQCGKPLRTNQAKQCFVCGADWH
jgi:hypothetical protein